MRSCVFIRQWLYKSVLVGASLPWREICMAMGRTCEYGALVRWCVGMWSLFHVYILFSGV